METFVQVFAGLVAVGAAAVVAFVVAHQIIKLRRSWHEADASRLLNLEAVEREKAETRKVHAEADTMLIKAQTEARLIPVNAGGAYGFIDLPTGLHIPALVNNNVPTSQRIEMHGGFGANIAAPGAPELAASVDPLPVMLALADARREARPNLEAFEIVLGKDAGGGYIVRPFGDDMLHFGLLGATRSGKSSQAQSVLFQLCLADPSARRVKLGFIDTEGKTSKPFKQAPHTLFIADDPDSVSDALTMLEEEMARRARLEEAELNALPMWAIMLEEYLSLKDELGKEDWSRLIRIATRARKSHIYLLCASQAFYASEDTRIIRGQLRTRAAFAVEDAGTLTAFGIKDTTMHAAIMADPKPGRFLLRTPSGLTLAQAAYVAPDAIAQWFQKRAAQPAAVPVEVYAGATAPTQPSAAWSPAMATAIPALGAAPDNKTQRAMLYYRVGMTKAELMTAADCSEYTASEALRRLKRATG